MAAAAGAVAECVGPSCCCCADMPAVVHETMPADYTGGHNCCSSPANIPCDLTKNNTPDTQFFVVSTAKEKQSEKDGHINIVMDQYFSLRANIDYIKAAPSCITSDPIPIYLKNQTFIC